MASDTAKAGLSEGVVVHESAYVDQPTRIGEGTRIEVSQAEAARTPRARQATRDRRRATGDHRPGDHEGATLDG